MGKQKTITGAYSEQEIGGKGSKDKVRNVDFGPAQGVVRDAYAIKSFAHLDGDQGVGSGPVPRSAGKVVQRDRTPPSQAKSWDMSDKILGKRRSPKNWR